MRIAETGIGIEAAAGGSSARPLDAKENVDEAETGLPSVRAARALTERPIHHRSDEVSDPALQKRPREKKISGVRIAIIESPEIDYGWKDAGEEWSEPWGGSAAQWFGAIFPRISEYLPAGTILEIAPGFGRWTHYLKEHCERLHVVDPDARCIEVCRRRFEQDSRLSYHVNDGRSLAIIPDRSIDFVFSFDSLVHVPRELVEAYLRQLGDKLKDDSVGFIHHSNFGEYASSLERRLPKTARKLLTKAKILDPDHQRAPDMTAELFQSCCAAHGLHCLRQELINWRGRRLVDCFTTFSRASSKWSSSSGIIRNPNFMREARLIRQRSQA